MITYRNRQELVTITSLNQKKNQLNAGGPLLGKKIEGVEIT